MNAPRLLLSPRVFIASLGLALALPAAAFAQFTNGTIPANPSALGQIVVTDLDRDGRADIVASVRATNQIAFLLSSQTPQAWQTLTVGPAGGVNPSLAVGDFNADGVMDIAVGTELPGNNTVTVLFGDQTWHYGGYWTLATIPVASPPIELHIARSGISPVLIVQFPSGYTMFQSNIPDWQNRSMPPTFTQQWSGTSTATGGYVQAVATGDFDRNGFDDFATSNGATISAPCQSNCSPVTLPGNPAVRAMHGADVNGDGSPDILAGTADGRIFIYRNTANGLVPMAGSPIQIAGATRIVGIKTADFNRDGILDLAALDDGQNRVSVLIGNGDGTFTTQLAGSPVQMTGVDHRAFDVGDVTGDGLPDIVVNGDGSAVRVLVNTTPALWATPKAAATARVGRTSPVQASLRVNGNTTGGTWSAATSQPFLSLNPASGPTGAASAITASANPAGLSLGKYVGTLSFTAAGFLSAATQMAMDVIAPAGTFSGGSTDTLPQSGGWDYRALAPGDIDGNDTTDVVAFDSWGGVTPYFFNGTSFSAGAPTYFGYWGQGFTVADFNGDGKLDAAMLRVDSTYTWIQIALGNGAGGFTVQTGMVVGDLPGMDTTNNGYDVSAGLVARDVNGDGRVDLLARVGPVLKVLIGRPGGALDPSVAAAFWMNEASFRYGGSNIWQNGAGRILTGDFNGDGKLDVILPDGGSNAGPFQILEGDGGGSFKRGAAGSFYGVPAVGDLNGDGRDDLIVLAQFGTTGSVVLGGPSYPAVPSTLTVPYGTQSATLVDLDGDGDLDLVLGAYGNGVPVNGLYYHQLGVLLGDGAGGFSPAKYMPLLVDAGQRFEPINITTGDVQGDGRPDVMMWRSLKYNSPIAQLRVLLGAPATTAATLSLTTATVAYGQPAPVSLSVATTGVAFATPTGTAVLSENGTTMGIEDRPNGGPWTFANSRPSVGSHTVSAVYQGDGASNSSPNSNSVTFSVTKANGTIALWSSQPQSPLGQAVTFTATLTPASAGGIVTFKDGAATLGQAAFDANGQATYTTSALSGGTHAITAQCAGDANVNAATSAAITQTITKAIATVSLSGLAQNYTGAPRPVTATATRPDLSPLAVTVTYTVNGAPTSTAPSAVGSYTVSAAINDPDYDGSATGTLVVGKGSATVTFGQTTFMVDGAPKPVQVTTSPVGLNVTITYVVGGAATTAAPSALGSYPVTATIDDPNYQGTASATLVIDSAPITATNLSSSSNPSTFGAAVTLTATISGGVAGKTGTVTFFDGATAIGAFPIGSGVVSFTTSALEPGVHTLTAAYSGDATNAPSTSSPFTLTVNKAAATVTLTGGTFAFDGAAKAAMATTTPADLPVTITYNGASTAPTVPGTYAVVATIDDAHFAGGATTTLVVTTGSLGATLAGLADQVWTGQPHPVTVATNPAGLPVTVTYTPQGGFPTTTAPTAAGQYLVTVSAPFYETVTSPMLIGRSPVTVRVTGGAAVVDGQPHAVTVLTSPAGASYAVTYRASDGTVSTQAPSTAGLYTVLVEITDPNFAGSGQATLDLHAKNTPTVTLSGPTSSTYGQGVTYTATLDYAGAFNGRPATGVVKFYEQATVIATRAVTGGPLQFSTGFAVGSHSLSARYEGDAENEAAWSNGVSVLTTKATPTFQAQTLRSFVYDKSPKTIAFTTSLGVALDAVVYRTAAGALLPSAPVNAGTYTASVSVSASEPNYTGTSAPVTFTIAKATATISIGGLSRSYTGDLQQVTLTTNPGGLFAVALYYQNGNLVAPRDAGTYQVVASIYNDPNYTAAETTATLVIQNSGVQIAFGNLLQDFNPWGNAATVTTTPAAVNGIPLKVRTVYRNAAGTMFTEAPRGAGVYTVISDVLTPGLSGHAEATLIVRGRLSVKYDTSRGFVRLDGDIIANDTPLFVAPGAHTLTVEFYNSAAYRYRAKSWSGCVSSCSGMLANGTLPFNIGVLGAEFPQTYTLESVTDVYVGTRAVNRQNQPVIGPRVDPGGWVPLGQTITLTQTPSPGLAFYQWSTPGRSWDTPTLTLTALGPEDVKVIYYPAYDVNFSASPKAAGDTTYRATNALETAISGTAPGEGGSIKVSRPNSQVNVFATPRPGWVFSNWSGDGYQMFSNFARYLAGSTQMPVPLVPTADAASVVANYRPGDPVLDLAVAEDGSITIKNVGPLKVRQLRLTGYKLLATTLYDGNTVCSEVLAAIDESGAVDVPLLPQAAQLINMFPSTCPDPLPKIKFADNDFPTHFGDVDPGQSSTRTFTISNYSSHLLRRTVRFYYEAVDVDGVVHTGGITVTIQ